MKHRNTRIRKPHTAVSAEPTQERLKELFDYVDGHLIRKTSGNGFAAGQKLGCLANDSGYMVGCVDRRQSKLHRLIYIFHHGFAPKYLDHINNVRTDNRIENLRECTKQENSRNRNADKQNPTGFKGVFHLNPEKYPSYKSRPYRAALRISKDKVLHLGLFATPEQAALVYNAACFQEFGAFAKLNDVVFQ